MKESADSKKIMSVMFGAFLIGSVAALIKVYNATKNIERSFENVAEDGDEEIFI